MMRNAGVLLALACACGQASAAEANASDFEARLRIELAEVAKLCPPMSAYPEPVEAIPLPWEIQGKPTDELLAMLENWNPARRRHQHLRCHANTRRCRKRPHPRRGQNLLRRRVQGPARQAR